MIKHSIITNNKQEPVRYQSKRLVANQKELDSYLATDLLFEEDFVVSVWRNNLPIENLYSVYVIVEVLTDFSKINLWDAEGNPKVFRRIQCAYDNQSFCHMSWDSREELRLLTKEDYLKLVEPNLDKIQDHIKRKTEELSIKFEWGQTFGPGVQEGCT